jgi:hypothetical protein
VLTLRERSRLLRTTSREGGGYVTSLAPTSPRQRRACNGKLHFYFTSVAPWIRCDVNHPDTQSGNEDNLPFSDCMRVRRMRRLERYAAVAWQYIRQAMDNFKPTACARCIRCRVGALGLNAPRHLLVAFLICGGAGRIVVPAITASDLVVPGTQGSVAAFVRLDITGNVFQSGFSAPPRSSERSRLRH